MSSPVTVKEPFEITSQDVRLFQQNFPQHFQLLQDSIKSGDFRIVDKAEG